MKTPRLLAALLGTGLLLVLGQMAHSGRAQKREEITGDLEEMTLSLYIVEAEARMPNEAYLAHIARMEAMGKPGPAMEGE